MTMPTELEAKIRVEDHDGVRTRLRAAGATRLGRFHEVDHFLDTPSQSLRQADRGLRLRTSRNTETGESTHLLTYKGPRQAGALKQREEIELTVNDPAAAQSLFEALEYKRGLMFEKLRESWAMRGCRVELDEVAELGRFVEVEGPTAAQIEAVLNLLGLEGQTPIRESYPQLLMQP